MKKPSRESFRCPVCGWEYFSPWPDDGLVPVHGGTEIVGGQQRFGRQCNGTGQKARGSADRRPLWSKQKEGGVHGN